MARIDIKSTVKSEDFMNYVRSLPEAKRLPDQAAFDTGIIRDAEDKTPLGYILVVTYNGAGIAMSKQLSNPYGWYARLAMRNTIRRAIKVLSKIGNTRRLVKTV